MAKTANKFSGEVALPDSLGRGLFIRFTVDAMERLESEFGEDWVEEIVRRTGKTNIAVFRTVIENTLVKSDIIPDYSKLSGSASETRVTILNALMFAIYGRSLDEQIAHEEKERVEEVSKKLEAMGEDPQLASALVFYQGLGELATAPASDQMKSDASPQEK